jgi:hypothetical protein
MSDKEGVPLPQGRLLWSIGSEDGRSRELVDNYKDPNSLGDVVWTAGGSADQRWPLFHPSEADPDGGYRLHPYTILFELDGKPADRCRLLIRYLVIAPRLAYLEIRVNGVTGFAYLQPEPSRSGDIRLHSGLHTTIYSEGTLEVLIPGSLLREGMNRLELIARDDGEVIVIDNAEAIKRLDRMANGAGFLYQRIAFEEIGDDAGELGAGPVRRALVRPSVVYYRNAEGELMERVHVYLELNESLAASEWTLAFTENGRESVQTFRAAPAAFGHLRFTAELFDGEGMPAYRLSGETAASGTAPSGAKIEFAGSVKRRRKWNVYIASHAHTDIGYTHRQWEVAERLCRNIDTALELLEEQDRMLALNPDAEPAFAYHMDASWALETWLATRSAERKEKLLRYIREGRVQLAANYVDLLTQYAALEDLIRNGAFTESFLRPAGLRAELAAFVDVASLTWTMPDVLAGSGVKYLVHANNQDRGPFRLNGGLNRVSPFYWEGPGGGRVLTWLAKMYCELRKVCGSPPVPDSAERGLEMWLEEYETDAYAPDAVLLYGQEADNTDLDPQPVAFVRRWNDQYAYPRLIAGDITDFFRYVEANFADRLVTLRGDGGAYWEDGILSSIDPTMKVRRAQAMLPAAERLESLAVIHHDGWTFPQRHYKEAWRELLLYVEHTWGAFLSGPDPDALLARDQWRVKERMAEGALGWAERLLHAAAVRHSLSWNTRGREIVAYNPHSWTVADEVIVEIGRNEEAVDPETGEVVPLRLVRETATQALVRLRVGPLPGFSYKRFALRERRQGESLPRDTAVEVTGAEEVVLENARYRLTVRPQRGAVVSWFDKELNRELADPADEWGFGQLLYAAGGEGTRLVSNQADLPERDPEVSGSFRLQHAELRRGAHGSAVVMRGEVPFGTAAIEWRLPAGASGPEVQYRCVKAETTAKEAVYVAFPLNQSGGQVWSDSKAGWVRWDRDQLPGACKEWLPLQTAVLSKREDGDVLIASPDIPLFCVGTVVQGRWPKEKDLTGGRLFSYVMNNYWHTNYKASQGGEINFRYRLTSGRALSFQEAYRFGWQSRIGLYAHRISYQDFRDVQAPYANLGGGTLAAVESEDERIVVSTIKRAEWADGFIIRLQDTSGEGGEARIAIPGRRIAAAWSQDLLERDGPALEPERDGSLRVRVGPWGLFTVRIVTAQP